MDRSTDTAGIRAGGCRNDGFRPVSRGAVAVEFAFIFPILFLLVYGTIVYAYVFVLKQSITHAAQEAAEAAVAIVPGKPNSQALREAAVRSTAASALSWLPQSQRQRVLGESGNAVLVQICPAGSENCPSDSEGLRVTLNFNLKTPTALFPVLNLYLVGEIPPLPDTLTASAVVRI